MITRHGIAHGTAAQARREGGPYIRKIHRFWSSPSASEARTGWVTARRPLGDDW